MRNSVMTFEHHEGTTWEVRFGEFAGEEAPILADSLVTLTEQTKAKHVVIQGWSAEIKAVIDHLIGQGFVFAESKDGAGEVVQRTVYRKRTVEEEL